VGLPPRDADSAFRTATTIFAVPRGSKYRVVIEDDMRSSSAQSSSLEDKSR
jgi:hypothetical protein